MQLKIKKFCNMFIQSVKNKCLSFGAKLKRKIVQTIFPGKIPRDTCQKIKLFVVRSEQRSNELALLPEFEKVNASLQEVVRAFQNSAWKLPYKCCMCKESVRMTRFLIMNAIQEKAEEVCNLIKSVREECMSKAKIFQVKIIRTFFPVSPYVMCKSLKVCK
ncbi:hypothetical protein QTP86_028883 [Hemibagrus guttatus]|nr:hypothetical protein QTP86_028883 [Hemibagrus guttatus]